MPREKLDLASLLAPQSIAIIGASPNLAGHAGRCLANLRKGGYDGMLFPVNPKYEEIDGILTYPEIGAVPAKVDTAYILLPSKLVEPTLEACATNGVRNVVICSSGFAETGHVGAKTQRRLAEIVKTHDTRILGPNCIGVLSVPESYMGTPTFNITHHHTPGHISLLSHSGGMAAVTFNRAQGRGIGMRSVVSLGNEADIEMAEVVDALVEDDLTRVIALFVEQLRDGERFWHAATRARLAGKPIVALKTGRSEAGRRAAFGHTGALAGEHTVFQGIMQQLGVIEVETIDALLTTADLLQKLPPPSGRRLGVLSPSGGETSYVADRASEAGLTLPSLDPRTEKRLQELLPMGSPSNPLDVTGQVIGDRELLEEVLATFSADPNFDTLLYSIPTWGDYDNQALLPAFVEAAQHARTPTVISMWQAHNLTELGDELLRQSSVPTTPTPDEAITAIAHLSRLGDLQGPAVDAADAPAVTSLQRRAGHPETLNEFEALEVLRRAGLPAIEERLVADAPSAATAAAAAGFPVVLKALANGITHKSDHGFVRVRLTSPTEVERAASDLIRLVEAQELTSEGLVLAPFIEGVEFMVGAVADQTFGPLVMVGAGGILAESHKDVSFRRAPVCDRQADQMLTGLRTNITLQPVRGKHPDRDSLVSLITKVSAIVSASPDLAGLDLNPVIVRDLSDGGGAYIVDAALRWTTNGEQG